MEVKKKKLSASFQQWLMLVVGIAFTVTLVFLWTYQTKLFSDNAESLLEVYIKDVCKDIYNTTDRNLLVIGKAVATETAQAEEITAAMLKEMLPKYQVGEINLVGPDGVILASTDDRFVGYDMKTGGVQTAEFMALLGSITEYVQRYQPIGFDGKTYRKYAGVSMPGGGFIQVGYDESGYRKALRTAVMEVAKNRHVGESGFLIVADKDWKIVSDRSNNEGQPITIVTAMTQDIPSIGKERMFEEGIYIDGSLQRSFCMYEEMEDYRILAIYPYSEAMVSRNVSLKVMTVMQVLIYGALFALVFILVRKLVVRNIHQVNRSLAAITEGRLDTVVDVRSHEEFNSLSNDINATVDTLKRYIKEAEERIDAELAFAKSIQHSALPSVFPPYPNRKEFEIFASMHTAKEVGGDFYDFYFIDEDHLAFLMADVSGKGIPAALFMMTAKTIIKSYAEAGMSVDQVFTHANDKLCESNEAGMFVTAWMGILNTKTGKVVFANAGHNQPLVKRANGTYEYYECQADLILAGFEGFPYVMNELQLAPGEAIYLYTDGVTEAVNPAEELYGEDRLRTVLERHKDASPADICAEVKKDVDAFAGTAPQFDDITMLLVRYWGPEGGLNKK